MLQVLDLFGTFVFAVAGAFRAIRYELDVLGLLVLATVTGVGGGLIRDLILDRSPPAAFADETYLVVCLGGGLVAWAAPLRIARRWDWVVLADALGLGVFAAIGAAQAARSGLGPVGVMMLAAVTATGGGAIRDVLVREIPVVLRSDFYATAALLGGGAFLIAGRLGAAEWGGLLVAALFTTGLRAAALRWGMELPRLKRLPANPSALAEEHRRSGADS